MLIVGFPTNQMMVSGVTHGYASILGDLMSQVCQLTPPFCAGIHCDTDSLRLREAGERTQALSSSLEFLKRQMTEREGAVLRQFQGLQREVASLELRLQQGEEDFFSKQAALIQSYDDKIREAAELWAGELSMAREELVDTQCELSHRQGIADALRADMEELKASYARSDEVAQQKTQRLKRMLVERSSTLYELVSGREGAGSSVSEVRVRELSRLLREEMRALEEQRLCVVCATEEKAIVLMPCRHHQICEPCSKELNICPLCRAAITDRIKIFS